LIWKRNPYRYNGGSWVLNPMTSVLMKEERKDTNTGEHHVKTVAEIKIRCHKPRNTRR
jgi:hypothetical protein